MRIKKMKIIILVLSSNSPVHFINRFFQKTTWAKSTFKNVQIINYFGGYKTTKFKNNNLLLDASNKFTDIGEKTYNAFKWCNKNLDFDFIFRTNSSSYIDVGNLIEYINNNNQITYSGSKAQAILRDKKYEFASGSGYFVSKQGVEQIVSNKNLWDFSLPDDVGLGELFTKLGIKNTIFKKNEITRFPLFEDIDYMLFHTRCKLNHLNIPRFFEGIVFLRLQRNYKLFKRKKKPLKILDYLVYYLFKFVQKFYPKKYFSKFTNLNYKRSLKYFNQQ